MHLKVSAIECLVKCVFLILIVFLVFHPMKENKVKYIHTRTHKHTHTHSHVFPLITPLLKTSNLFLFPYIYALIKMAEGKINFHGRSSTVVSNYRWLL
jgi:hypothetical protein